MSDLWVVTSPTEDQTDFTVLLCWQDPAGPQFWNAGVKGVRAWAWYLSQVAALAMQDSSFFKQQRELLDDFMDAARIVSEHRGGRDVTALVAPAGAPVDVSYVVNVEGEPILQFRPKVGTPGGWQMDLDAVAHHVASCMLVAATAPLDKELLSFYIETIGLDEGTARRALGALGG